MRLRNEFGELRRASREQRPAPPVMSRVRASLDAVAVNPILVNDARPVEHARHVAPPPRLRNEFAELRRASREQRPATTVMSRTRASLDSVAGGAVLASDVYPAEQVAPIAPRGGSINEPASTGTVQTIQRVAFGWRERVRPLTLQALSLSVIGLGIIMFVISFSTDKLIDLQIKSLPQTVSAKDSGQSSSSAGTSADSPAPSDASIYAYKRAANLPKRIEIKSLGVLARIIDVNTTKNGDIGTPITLYDVGWYTGSSNPQQSPGSAVIVGHVGGLSLPGIFSKLQSAQPGEEITVVMGNDKRLTYKVTTREQIPVVDIDMAKYLSYDEKGGAELHIITCGGRVNVQAHSYYDRIIVSAVREK
ncbi:MAG: class F sortase [Candidatus Saccharibacteria bacterium]